MFFMLSFLSEIYLGTFSDAKTGSESEQGENLKSKHNWNSLGYFINYVFYFQNVLLSIISAPLI